jgi:hypothetical protein
MLAECSGIRQQPNAARQAARETAKVAAHPLDLLDDQPRVLDKALTCGRRFTPRWSRARSGVPRATSMARMRALAEANARFDRSAPCVMLCISAT